MAFFFLYSLLFTFFVCLCVSICSFFYRKKIFPIILMMISITRGKKVSLMVIFYVDIASPKKYKEILSHFIREKKALKEFWMKKKLCENENKQTNKKKSQTTTTTLMIMVCRKFWKFFTVLLLSKKNTKFFFFFWSINFVSLIISK